MNYEDFLQQKELKAVPVGLDVQLEEIHQTLFDFQKDIVKWALKRGKAAIFANTGLGKTLMQLEWARQVHNRTNYNVLILAPLAVASQTVREASKIDLHVTHVRESTDVQEGVNIANYEILHKLDINKFGAIVLDESSILKSFTGKVRNQIIDGFRETPYKLACTATPAPNDHMELGNHSEFLNIMNRHEMLAMFFVHDGGSTQKWRLKGHAEGKFWEWVATWAVMITKPSDLGYENGNYDLPPLNMNEVVLEAEPDEGSLVPVQAETLTERRKARKKSLEERCQAAADLVNKSDEIFLVWCDLNDESALLKKLIHDSVEVKGSDTAEHKANAMLDFADGNIKALVTKPKIAGFGMNWQVCHNMIFVGLSDSFEQTYQAIRRCYRFGQENEVNVHFIISETEGAVLANIKRKENDFIKMQEGMVQFTRRITANNIQSSGVEKTTYEGSSNMNLPSFLKGEN